MPLTNSAITTRTRSSRGPTGGVLAVLADPALRAEVDRVTAAVGDRVIYTSLGAPEKPGVNGKAWLAATAVLLDESAANWCAHHELPRRAHVSVLTAIQAAATTWEAAIAVGAQHVLQLPCQEQELIAALADAAESAHTERSRGDVLAVIGGCGGAGASLFAVALAQAAHDALLIDLDPWSGGIDLLLGGEATPGLRWPDLTLRGGRLSWSAVHEALPQHRGIRVLSGSRHSYELDAGPVNAIVDAGRRGGATVICDLSRRLTDATHTALQSADLVIVVSPCQVRACAATAATAPVLATINPNLGLVVRGPAPGGLRAADVAQVAGLPLLASMRAEPRLSALLEHGGLRLGRRSALAAAARQVLAVSSKNPALQSFSLSKSRRAA